MAIGRPIPTLILDEVERETLERWVRRPKTAQALALRARMILGCAEGRSNTAVAADLGVSDETVGKWRTRFLERRLDGLSDEPRSGRPRVVTDDDVERVITLTLETTPRDATHWSTRSMAQRSGLSHNTVSRIWRAFGLQPHRTEAFKLSSDPFFIEKVRDIVGLYLDPPDRALVLCVDEKSQIQALDRTRPLLPMRPGQVKRRTHDYLRHGTVSLFAALDASTGKVIGRCHQRHRAVEFRPLGQGAYLCSNQIRRNTICYHRYINPLEWEKDGTHVMVGENSTHDARSLLGGLRDHLAQHERPIAFLFGAGTSCAVRVPSPENEGKMIPLIPDIAGLTESCEKAAVGQGERFASAWDKIFSVCEETKPKPNIEDVLSRLRMMLEAVGKDDTLAGLNRDELYNLEATIRQEIAKVVNPSIEHILGALPHRRFARWLNQAPRRQPVEIFTVNYDILIESALEAERVPLFDGFVGSYEPFFLPDSLRHSEFAPGSNWIRLWKMHGSVTWRKVEIDGRERLVRGEPDQSGEMILPSFQKYDESRQQPYAAFSDRLARFLDQDGALLVVCGFGFGDEHINNVIFEALESRPRTHAYALQFGEQDDDADLVRRSYLRHNMMVIGPETGIIGGRRGKWQISGDPAVFSDVLEVGESTEDPDGETNPSSTNEGSCKLKIGDFSQFCNFLANMMVR